MNLLGCCEVCQWELRVKRGEEPDRNMQKKSFVPEHCCRHLKSCTWVRWYHSWAAPERPPRGGHCCAGDVQIRRMVGVRRQTNEGNVCQTSTPMARQMADDLTKDAQMSKPIKTCTARGETTLRSSRQGAWNEQGFWSFLWKS